MFDKPTKEHEFFNDLVGEWTFEHTCSGTEEQSTNPTTGKAVARSYGCGSLSNVKVKRNRWGAGLPSSHWAMIHITNGTRGLFSLR